MCAVDDARAELHAAFVRHVQRVGASAASTWLQHMMWTERRVFNAVAAWSLPGDVFAELPLEACERMLDALESACADDAMCRLTKMGGW